MVNYYPGRIPPGHQVSLDDIRDMVNITRRAGLLARLASHIAIRDWEIRRPGPSPVEDFPSLVKRMGVDPASYHGIDLPNTLQWEVKVIYLNYQVNNLLDAL